jgi:hypothetical protein
LQRSLPKIAKPRNRRLQELSRYRIIQVRVLLSAETLPPWSFWKKISLEEDLAKILSAFFFREGFNRQNRTPSRHLCLFAA